MSDATGAFSPVESAMTSGRPCRRRPLEDWLELLDAVRRLVNRRRLRPEEENRVKKFIRERFPDVQF